MLLDGHARNLGYQRFCQATYLGVVPRHAGQWTAVAPDDESAILLFELRETTQLVEHTGGCLKPGASAVCRYGLAFHHTMTYRPEEGLRFLKPKALGKNIQQPAKCGFVSLGEQLFPLLGKLVDVSRLPAATTSGPSSS